MDVEIGAEDVSVSRRTLTKLGSWLVFLGVSVLGSSAFAALDEKAPLHWSGDKTYWDRKVNRVQLFGHGAVHQPGETITADYIVLDLNSRTIDTKGNSVYITSDSVIYSDEMHFNMDTRTGTIVNGLVSNDSFSLSGERINKLGPGRFQTHRGEYSTCRDCPESWTLSGSDVDLEVGGYAYMSDVIGKIKETPILWVPYLIVPIKTERQSGFLFPRWSIISQKGVNFVQPYFWAISRSTDMTIGLGHLADRGTRAEWEGRYVLSDTSSGQVNAFYLHDAAFAPSNSPRPHRWALTASQNHLFPWGISEKLRFTEVSDNFYPYRIGDVAGGGEAYLTSDILLNKQEKDLSTSLTLRRYRNLLYSDPIRFDINTVQNIPTLSASLNERFILGSPVAFGVNSSVANFTRTGAAFDYDPLTHPQGYNGPVVLGQDPIRKTTRVALTPEIYTTIRPFDLFSVVPAFEYRSFFYSFHNEIPNLSRGYLLFKTDFSFQLEKVYQLDDPEIPRVKHLFRPLLTYSLIPPDSIHEPSDHPFIKQIQYANANGFTGYNFDSYDIVPRDVSRAYSTSYFIPIGHSISYGFNTQLVRRRGAISSESPYYQRIVELRAGQTYNFRELHNEPGNQQPLSRLFGTLGVTFDKWSLGVDYQYIPYIPISDTSIRHIVSLSTSYTFESAIHQRILAYERSVGFAYSYSRAAGSGTNNPRFNAVWSINDYITPKGSISYDLVVKRLNETNLGLRFQSPSHCWRFDINFFQRIVPRDRPNEDPSEIGSSFDLSLNLSGSGFGGISEVSNATISK